MSSNPLRECFAVWEEELCSDIDCEFVLKGIKEGFSIIVPDTTKDIFPACCNNYKSVTDVNVKLKVERQILEEIDLGRYVVCHEKPLIVSALGAVPKAGSDSLRLIHDCSRPAGLGINAYAEPDAVKFNTVDNACSYINRGFYMAKLDLKSAYRYVGIRPSHYALAGLQWTFAGHTIPTYMVDTRLMFGASQAVGIFHRISNALVRMIQSQITVGRVINYLDDFLIVAPTREECQHVMNVSMSLIGRLGFDINYTKVVYPSTQVTFLGIVLDSDTMYMHIPVDKLCEIKGKAANWVKKSKATKRELQSLAGSIAWGAKCIKAMRPILRGIINLYKGLRAPHHHIRLPKVVKADIQYFLHWCDTFNGVSFCASEGSLPVTYCFTDATMLAGAACWENDFLYATWAHDVPALANECIYVKELAAVHLAIQRWSHAWSNHYVILNVDNQGVLWSLRKGLVKNCIANDMVHDILWLAAIHNITLDVRYVASADNVLADTLSRLADHKNVVIAFSYLAQCGVDPFAPNFDLLNHMSTQSFSLLLSRYVAQGAGIRCPDPQI